LDANQLKEPEEEAPKEFNYEKRQLEVAEVKSPKLDGRSLLCALFEFIEEANEAKLLNSTLAGYFCQVMESFFDSHEKDVLLLSCVSISRCWCT